MDNGHENSYGYQPAFSSIKPGERWISVNAENASYFYNPVTGETRPDLPTTAYAVQSNSILGLKPDEAQKSDEATRSIFPTNEYNDEFIGDSEWVLRHYRDGRSQYFNAVTGDTRDDDPTLQKTQENYFAVGAEPIPDSDWFIVKTSKEEVFYFNKKSNKSSWEKPTDLEGNIYFHKVFSTFTKSESVSVVDDVEEKDLEKSAKKIETAKDTLIQKTSSRFGPENEKVDVVVQQQVQHPDKIPRRNQFMSFGSAGRQSAHIISSIPYYTRSRNFVKMLDEHNISAFSTWEKESEKFSQDPRFLDVTMKEAKAEFNEYLKKKVNTESSTTRKVRETNKEKFFTFLKSVVSDPRMKYIDFSSKFSDHPEFEIFSRTRDRETYFEEFMENFIRSVICVDPKKIKQNFWTMLLEANAESMEWKDVKMQFKPDLRFQNVDSMKLRKSWFRQFVKEREEDKELENKTKEEIAEIKLRKRKIEVEESRDGLDKMREKTIRIFERRAANDKVKVFLNENVLSSQMSIDAVFRMFEKYEPALLEQISSFHLSKLIKEHLATLDDRQTELLACTLDDLIEAGTINLKMHYKEVREIIHRARSIVINLSDKVLKAKLAEYGKTKEGKLIQDFTKLLQETKLIDLILKRQRNNYNMEDVVKELVDHIKTDRFYTRLDYISEKRDKLIVEFVQSKQPVYNYDSD